MDVLQGSADGQDQLLEIPAALVELGEGNSCGESGRGTGRLVTGQGVARLLEPLF